MGMFVQDGARARLLTHEREKFLTEEWPRIKARMAALELDPKKLLSEGSTNE